MNTAALAPERLNGSVFAMVTRIHIVAIGALGTLTFGWIFLGRYAWLCASLSAVDWFLVNILNRVVDLREDAQNRIVGTGFVEQHRRLILVGGFGLLGASLLFSHAQAPSLTPFRLAFHTLGLAYNWPILPGRRRIKELYFWKNTASATGFLLTVFAYPLAWAGGFQSARVVPLAVVAVGLFFFLFELSYEVIYDFRDVRGDAAVGVRSFPVVHGQATAARIVDGLLLASSLVLVGGFLANVVPWRAAVMAVAPAAQALWFRRALRRGITSADCVGLTWFGAGLLLTYHLWVFAGLPGV